MFTEFWLTYQFTSRVHLPPTTQLIELENPEHKLTDLEDVLAHVFRQGFIEAKYRPVTWWEKKDGVKVKACTTIDDLLIDGIGKCPDTALKLVIEDMPTNLWFSYHYIHNPPVQVVTQRIKFAGLSRRFEKLAHVTNYVFAQGFLPSKYRAVVYWQSPCGKRINECAAVDEILIAGEGISEEKSLRLVIDDKLPHESCGGEREHNHHHHHESHEHHHHHYTSCPSTPTVAGSPLKTVSRFY